VLEKNCPNQIAEINIAPGFGQSLPDRGGIKWPDTVRGFAFLFKNQKAWMNMSPLRIRRESDESMDLEIKSRLIEKEDLSSTNTRNKSYLAQSTKSAVGGAASACRRADIMVTTRCIL